MDSFSKVIGHEYIKKILLKMYNDKNIPSFMIFEGPFGVGKAQMAYEFAKLLMFDNKKEPFNSPDFYLIYPVSRNTEIDITVGIRPLNFAITKEIGIDTIRQLIKELAKKGAYEAEYRFVLILNGENLNIESQNALLKTLEEVPKKTIIIMIVSHKERILPTVYSRAKKFYFGPLKFEEFKKYTFEGQFPVTVLYNLSGGSIGRAKKIESSFVYSQRGEFTKSLIKRDFMYIYDFFEEVSQDKGSILDFLDMFSTILRDLYVMHYNGIILNTDIENDLRKLKDGISMDVIEELLERVKKTYNMVLANVQKRYVLLYLIGPLFPSDIRDKYDTNLEYLWEF